MIFDIIPPPARYDHAFDGKIYEALFSLAAVDGACRKLGATGYEFFVACTLRMGVANCIMYLPFVGPGGVAPRTDKLLRQHETAHCNGWSASHPQ